jgi:hypothetical protein
VIWATFRDEDLGARVSIESVRDAEEEQALRQRDGPRRLRKLLDCLEFLHPVGQFFALTSLVAAEAGPVRHDPVPFWESARCF